MELEKLKKIIVEVLNVDQDEIFFVIFKLTMDRVTVN